jgi:hypothetical protein
MADKEFNVFLCHNHEDKPVIRRMAGLLLLQGVKPWLDEWELQPGLPWQQALEQQISNIKSAAVFVGDDGVGPWQRLEVDAFLRQFVQRNCPVIPVLLPDTPTEPQLPLFLQGFTWVDFRKSEPEPLSQLIWGITGKRVAPIVLSPEDSEKISRPGWEAIQELRAAKVETMAATINEQLASEPEVGELLTAIRDTLIEMKKAGLVQASPALAREAGKVAQALDDPKADMGHKLKVALPIIPGILSYETELSLKGGVNLKAAWQRLFRRMGGNKIAPSR